MTTSLGYDTIVTSKRSLAHQVEHTQLVRELPHFAFIPIHQRSMNHEMIVHSEVQRHIQ